MKVILTGSTGFIGGEVLEQCLQNARITSIIALSRRELSPSVTHNPKLKVLIMENFLSYSPSILQGIRDAEVPTAQQKGDEISQTQRALGKARIPDNETNKRVSIEYTLAAARTFRERVESQQGVANNARFRFIYLSGGGAERDQTKSLWFMQDYRRIRVTRFLSS